MRYIKAIAEIMNDDALSRDMAVNTFHFRTDETGTIEQEIFDINTHLRAFYAVVDQYLSVNVAATDGLRIKYYNHEDAPPRVPVDDTLASITPGAFGLPNEVAICISYLKTPVSGANRRRQRGRIYFGPLSSSVLNTRAGDMEVAGGVRVVIADAAHDNLMDFVGGISGSEIWWSVFSRSDALGLSVGEPGPSDEPTYSSGELNLGYHTIDTVYVDNALDTQRRRGLTATARNIGA